MSEDFDTKIVAASRQREAIKFELALLHEQWLQAVVPWVVSSWNAYARKIALGQHAHTTRLQSEGRLDEVKLSLRALEHRARTEVEPILVGVNWPHGSDKDAWWMINAATTRADQNQLTSLFHVKDPPIAVAAGQKVYAPGPIAYPEQRALALAAEVLRDHGYSPTDASSPGGGHGLVLQHRPVEGWSTAMVEQIRAYASLHQDALDLTAEITRLNAEKSITAAASAWDA